MCEYRTVIVDDKWLIRTELKYMLSKYPNIKVIGEAETATEAFELISETKPDVVFLDIHMPDFSGFDLLKKLNFTFKVIFISAYKKYMEESQKYHPVDFLLKPINVKKLSMTIQKLQETVAPEGTGV